MSARAWTLACAVCLAMLTPIAVSAQTDAFRKGLEALRDKKWAEAASQLQQAIENDRTETTTRQVKVGGFGPFGGDQYPYLPHFFLGEALMAQNNCAGAIVAFAESERQGVVNGQRLVTLRGHYQTCAASGVLAPAAYDPLYRRTNQRYTEAMGLFKRVSGLVAANKGVAPANADETLERARVSLESSYKSLNDGTRSRRQTDFTDATTAADRGTEVLRRLETAIGAAIDTRTAVQRQLQELERLITVAEGVDREIDASGVSLTAGMASSRKTGRTELARAREAHAAGPSVAGTVLKEALEHARSASAIFTEVVGEANRISQGAMDDTRARASRAADNAFLQVEGVFTSFTRRVALETTPLPDAIGAERDKLRREADALKRRLARASREGDIAGLTLATQQATDVRTRLETLMQALPPLSLRARGISAGLEEGARLYLRGEFQQALTALDGTEATTDPPSPMQIHLHLFRAAARYALYLRSGETKKELLAQVLSDIERAKQLDATLAPDPRAFAPQFIQLYQRGRGTTSRQ